MRFFLLTLTLLAGANFLQAQGSPPFFTDDAATLSKSQWELDLGVATERARTGDRSWEMPSADLAYGLTDRIELEYGTSWVGVRPVDESSKSGLGHSVVGVKWRFLELDDSGFSASVNPQIEFNNRPSSHRRGLVEDGTEVTLPFQIAKTFGDISTALNVGRSFHSRDPHETDAWLAGLAVGRKVSERLQAGVEIYGETSRRFERGWLLFNVGACYTVNDTLSFSASAGRGFSGAERPDYVAFFGVQLVH